MADASLAVTEKKGASKAATSSLRKCPPWPLNYKESVLISHHSIVNLRPAFDVSYLVAFVVKKGRGVETRFWPVCPQIPSILEHVPESEIIVCTLRELEGISHNGNIVHHIPFRVCRAWPIDLSHNEGDGIV